MQRTYIALITTPRYPTPMVLPLLIWDRIAAFISAIATAWLAGSVALLLAMASLDEGAARQGMNFMITDGY